MQAQVPSAGHLIPSYEAAGNGSPRGRGMDLTKPSYSDNSHALIFLFMGLKAEWYIIQQGWDLSEE